MRVPEPLEPNDLAEGFQWTKLQNTPGVGASTFATTKGGKGKIANNQPKKGSKKGYKQGKMKRGKK